MLALTVASASSAFATATTVGYTETPTLGTLVIKLSKNVSLNYKSAGDNTGYAVATYHNKGTKSFGSSSGDSKIYENPSTAQDAPDAPIGTASANFASPWVAL